MSRIVVVGGTGTIGSAIVEALDDAHDILRVGHSSGPHRVDIASRESIEDFFASVSAFDHLVSAAGEARFGTLDELTGEDWEVSLENKLMGQLNLVRIGRKFAADAGSFTLTSGILSDEPTPGSGAISTVNAGLEGFVRAADLELQRELRINVVSPDWVSETLESMGRDPSEGVPAEEVAEAYVSLIDDDRSGEVVSVA